MPTRQAQMVLVIQDASRELCTEGLRYALQSLSLQSGDKIKLLRVVQPFKTASAFTRILQLRKDSLIIILLNLDVGAVNRFGFSYHSPLEMWMMDHIVHASSSVRCFSFYSLNSFIINNLFEHQPNVCLYTQGFPNS